MAARSYDNFDLLIESAGSDGFSVRVTACPVGDTASARFVLPFSRTELENLLLKLDPGRQGLRRIVDPHTQASMDLGGGLFDAVFRDEVLVAWSRSKDAVRQAGHGLRLRLRMTDAPSLAGLPWELLYDRKANVFYAQSERTPLVRYLDVADPPRPLQIQGPLRILVVISSPNDLPPLDVTREWSEIRAALKDKERSGLVNVQQLPHASLRELQRWLRRNEVHVLHFVGHGDFDERIQDGELMFVNSLGRAAPVTSATLGAHIRDHDPLRLVVLNACKTARADIADPYSGMAQGLVQQEAAAVVAMQFPITDDAAIVFTTEFYSAIADGEPVDQALASARKALLSSHGPEWATPVLFLRAGDGRVFERVDARPTVRPEEPSADLSVQEGPHDLPNEPRVADSLPRTPEPLVRSIPDQRPVLGNDARTEQGRTPDTTDRLASPWSAESITSSSRRRRRRRRRTVVVCTAATALVAAALVGAIASHGSGRTKAGPTPPTALPAATTHTVRTPATTATPAQGGGGGDAAPSTASGSAPQCRTSALDAQVSPDGAAGHVYTTITFTNKSATACSLHGYPGVSLRAAGTQVGQPAQRVGTYVRPVTLAPGEQAHDLLTDSVAACTDSSPQQSEVVRIFPPNQAAYIERPLAIPACPLTIDPIVTLDQDA